MTEAESPKKKRRRRRRRRRASLGGVGQPQAVPATSRPPIETEEDEAAENRAIEQQRRQQARTDAEAGEMLDQVIRAILPARDIEILDWLCRASGNKRIVIVKQMLRAAIIRERPAYREAHGGGGATSKNLEALSERIPVRR